MLDFDLSRFRQLAFGRKALPEHPLNDEGAVQKIVAGLPVETLAGIAELTHWVMSVNADDSFTPGRRARVLMALDAAARPYWSDMAMQYLAPYGTAAEGQDGDTAILRAMLESANGFAGGFGYCLENRGTPSSWAEKNFAQVALRRARWLARKFTLANMLHLPSIDDVWEDLHSLYKLAEKRDVLKKALRVYPGKPLTSSVKQEYTRLVMLEMAGLETMRGREIELAFRVAGRIVPNARLEEEPLPGATCAIEVSGHSRPTAVRRLQGSRRKVLYLDAFNCLPRLKAMMERDMGSDISGPDTIFGEGFTLRERNAMIGRLIDLWGPSPPQRRHKRVALNEDALVRAGFESAAEVIPALDQGDLEAGRGKPRIQLVLDAPADGGKQKEKIRKALAAARVKLVDASAGGIGLLVPGSEARWAKLGLLVAVYVEPGPDWVVGVLRRIHPQGDSLGLGIAVLARHPRLVWFELEATGYASVWEEEKRHERNFLDYFQRGIALEADRAPLGPGEMVIAPGIADRGSRLQLPMGDSSQGLRVTSTREATGDFHRIAFESLGVGAK